MNRDCFIFVADSEQIHLRYFQKGVTLIFFGGIIGTGVILASLKTNCFSFSSHYSGSGLRKAFEMEVNGVAFSKHSDSFVFFIDRVVCKATSMSKFRIFRRYFSGFSETRRGVPYFRGFMKTLHPLKSYNCHFC